MKYKFNKDKYITKGIQIEIPLELQIFLWNRIEEMIASKVELDYLQIFNINKSENMISITHSQEEPIPFEREYNIFDEEVVETIKGSVKLYVIDNIDHSIMLLASEY